MANEAERFLKAMGFEKKPLPEKYKALSMLVEGDAGKFRQWRHMIDEANSEIARHHKDFEAISKELDETIEFSKANEHDDYAVMQRYESALNAIRNIVG